MTDGIFHDRRRTPEQQEMYDLGQTNAGRWYAANGMINDVGASAEADKAKAHTYPVDHPDHHYWLGSHDRLRALHGKEGHN